MSNLIPSPFEMTSVENLHCLGRARLIVAMHKARGKAFDFPAVLFPTEDIQTCLLHELTDAGWAYEYVPCKQLDVDLESEFVLCEFNHYRIARRPQDGDQERNLSFLNQRDIANFQCERYLRTGEMPQVGSRR